MLVAAATVAVGLLSVAVGQPASPAVGVVTAASSVAAVATLALAGRILVLTTQSRRPRRRR